MTTLRFGALDPRHRARLAEILDATAAFSREEVSVALELFDETLQGGRVPAKRVGTAGARAAAGAREAGGREARGEGPPSSYEFLGAFDDAGTLAGYACYGATPGADGTFDLYWIAVHPGAQGAGAGTRLLAEVERRVRERGGRLVIVETSSRAAYARTRRFYDARGYHEAALVADFYAPADDRMIYVKRLRPRGAAAARERNPQLPDERGARHYE